MNETESTDTDTSDAERTNHVVIDVPPGGMSVAKEAIEYRVGPYANYTSYYHRRNWRLVMWGEQVDEDTLRRLGDACHDLEMEHKEMGMYEDAENADQMEGAFIFENRQERYLHTDADRSVSEQ